MRVHFILLFFVAGGTFCLKHKEESCSKPGDSCITYTKECPSIPLQTEFRRHLPKCELSGSTTFSVCCSKLLPSEVCSQRLSRVRMSSKISAGREAKRSDWPWIVAVGYMESIENELNWVCGGSLLNDRFVLTAAHCEASRNAKYHVARLGDLDLANDTDMKHVDIRVTFIKHKNYMRNLAVNDIALLKLASRVTFTEHILPVCLPLSNQLPTNYVGKEAYVAGWGITKDQKPSSKLLETEVTVKNDNICYNLMKSKITTGYSSDMWVCTQSEADTKDSCTGDSGGPVMIEMNGAYYQVGIVSQGSDKECGSVDNVGFNMNVNKYLTWIYDQMEANKN